MQTKSVTFSIHFDTVQPSGFRLLPQWVARAQGRAVAGDPSWVAAKAMLDANLPKLLNLGAYQGSWLTWATEYAMGYVCAKAVNDATRADQYARKAVAIALSAVRDYQKGGEVSRQFLTLADGTSKVFTLPDPAASILASVNVFTTPASWKAIVRGAAATDSVDYYAQFIAVSDTPGGPTYTQGTDWKHSGDYGNDQILWIAGGRQPVKGATYYVQEATLFANVAPFTRTGNVVTLNTLPAANTAVFAEYVRTDYSQTGAGTGGLNSAFIDSGGYAARYLGKAVASVLDWCAGHPVLEANRAELSSVLAKWCDWLTANGYYHTSIQSNYGAGEYLSKVCAATVLAGTPNGDRLKSEVLAFRTATVLPQLAQLAGGFWPEGWNYGAMAADGLLFAAEAMRQAGWIDGVAERAFASDVCEHLVYASPAPGVIISAGDFYNVPAPIPPSEYQNLFAVSADPLKGGLLGPQPLPVGWKAMSYPPLPAPQPKPTLLSKSGAGLTIARTGWTSTDLWAYKLAGNLIAADHQQYAAGHVELWRGSDVLLANGVSYTGNQYPNSKCQSSNTLIADANGDTNVQTYRFNQGQWYGTPGVKLLAFSDDGDLCHVATDCTPSYSHNQHPGDGGPLAKWVRHKLLVRSLGAVIVTDLLTMKQAAYYREQRWHVSPGVVSLIGNAFAITRGASALSGVILSGQPLTVSQTTVTGNGYTVPQLRFVGPTSTAFVGVFQAGASGATFPTPAYWTDGVREGCTLAGRRFAFDGSGGMMVV